MRGDVPANWMPRALIGPGLWAAGFASVYALHGLGCAQGWHLLEVGHPRLTLHRLAMVAVWLGTLSACIGVLTCLPRGRDMSRRLPRLGAWIGLGATTFTLAPLLVLNAC